MIGQHLRQQVARKHATENNLHHAVLSLRSTTAHKSMSVVLHFPHRMSVERYQTASRCIRFNVTLPRPKNTWTKHTSNVRSGWTRRNHTHHRNGRHNLPTKLHHHSQTSIGLSLHILQKSNREPTRTATAPTQWRDSPHRHASVRAELSRIGQQLVDMNETMRTQTLRAQLCKCAEARHHVHVRMTDGHMNKPIHVKMRVSTTSPARNPPRKCTLTLSKPFCTQRPAQPESLTETRITATSCPPRCEPTEIHHLP